MQAALESLIRIRMKRVDRKLESLEYTLRNLQADVKESRHRHHLSAREKQERRANIQHSWARVL